MYKKLIGKNIKNVYIEKYDQSNCVLDTDDGYYVINLYGECCSESFVGDVLRADKGVVESVEEIEIMEGEVPERESRQEYDRLFGLKIKFKDKESNFGDISSDITMCFRNASNGYYGGSINDVCKLNKFDKSEYIKIEETPKSFF